MTDGIVREYFLIGQTVAAPFVSDTVRRYVMAESPDAAVGSLLESLGGEDRMYSIAAYGSADAVEKGQKPLAMWLCARARAEWDYVDGRWVRKR